MNKKKNSVKNDTHSKQKWMCEIQTKPKQCMSMWVMCVKLNGNLFEMDQIHIKIRRMPTAASRAPTWIHFNHGIIILRSHWYRFNSFLLMTLTIISRISSSIPNQIRFAFFSFFICANVELYAIDLSVFFSRIWTKTKRNWAQRSEENMEKKSNGIFASRCLLYFYWIVMQTG